jgi:hypothetical protein
MDGGGFRDGASLSEEAAWRRPWGGAPSLRTLCRKCGTEEETSVCILCECEVLASLRHTHLGSFFLDPEDIRKLNIGAIWNFGKGTGLL